MTSETNSVAKSGGESVVIARFDSYRHAEHMLASLGRGFRTKARKRGATAVVVRGNPDGSLKVTESRVLSASDPERRAHELLAEAGPHGALVLARCKDQETRQMVAAAAAGSASGSWAGSPFPALRAIEALAARDRVPDLAFTLVGLRGLEPRTSSLSGKRSNRLSYSPRSGGSPIGPRPV